MKNKIGSFSLMKKMNTALILNKIRSEKEISRIELAKATGLTAATVTNITARLIDAGIIQECAVGASTGGRKPVMLKLKSNRYCIAGAYISPTGVKLALSDFASYIIREFELCFSSDNPSPDDCVNFIAHSLGEFSKENTLEVAGLGVGVHGTADSSKGVIINAPLLKWKNIAIKDMLCKKTGLDVYVENDVRLMAMSEMWFGNAQNRDDFVLLYVGSGVGAAVVSDSRLVRGTTDTAGEIGHSIINIDGPLCECGMRGCLQAHTNEAAMKRVLQNNLDKTSVLSPDSSCSEIMEAYITGDKAAEAVVNNEVKYLSAAILNIANIFNPAMIVVASGIKGFDKAVVSQIKKVPSSAMGGAESTCVIKASCLGDDAVLKGGIAKVLDAICNNPIA